MKYFKLISKLSNMDRCHNGPEMHKAYKILCNNYTGSKILKYKSGRKIYHWIIPPYWNCKKAILKDNKNKVIIDKKNNNLNVFSYSPKVNKKVSLEELNKHLISDPKRPNSTIFHFRNQYRHWKPDWGFSIPHFKRKKLKKGIYKVEIDSNISFKKDMIQADYFKKGKLKDEILLIGHFDHPSMVNDGLAGTVLAFEIVKKLKNMKTRFSYRAFASVENIGSVAYLNQKSNLAKNFKEALFLGIPGINSPIIYQQSYNQKSRIDKIIQHLSKFNKTKNKSIFKHRELIGNDENVFDSVGYNIPTGTLMRYPFKEYHSDKDNMEITSEKKLNEYINYVLKIIFVLENDFYIKANYKGIPSLSNPGIDLYLSPSKVSNLNEKNIISKNFLKEINGKKDVLFNKNKKNLNLFMRNILRLADGNNSILDICNMSKIPFFFALDYCNKLKEKKIIKFL